MTPLIFVCLLGAVFGYPQPVHDTPEVASAKAAHLAAVAKAHHEAYEHSWNGQDRSLVEDDGSYKEEANEDWKENEGSWNNNGPSWGTQSWATLPEKWTSPQVHSAPHQQWDAPQKKWTGPVALPPGYDKHGAPLPVLDTPEVAAEKSKHLHLYAHGAHAGSAASHTSSSWKNSY